MRVAEIFRGFAVLAVTVLLLSGCESRQNEAQQETRTLEEIVESGKLIVLTRNAPTTMYTDREEKQTGPEYDLVQSFAESLGVEVEYKIKNYGSDIIEDLYVGFFADGDAGPVTASSTGWTTAPVSGKASGARRRARVRCRCG